MKKIVAAEILAIGVIVGALYCACAASAVGPAAVPGPPFSFCSLYSHFNCSTTCYKCVSRCGDPEITNFSCGRTVNRTVVVTCTCSHESPPPLYLPPPSLPRLLSPPTTAPNNVPASAPTSGSPAVEVIGMALAMTC